MGRPSALYRTGEEVDLQGQATDAAVNAAKGSKIGGKLAAVGEDAAAGAAFGSAVGPWGTAIGGAAGAVYGAIDQFGGDVATAFNPPDFQQSDYDRIQQKCINGYQGGPRGAPVPGIAPDQYGACRYADGSVSGGDAPFPGSWNIGWDGDGKIVDPAAYARWKQGPLCVGADGLSVIVPPGMICNPGTGPVVPPMISNVTNLSARTRSILLNAVHAAPKPAPMPKVTAKPLPMIGGFGPAPKALPMIGGFGASSSSPPPPAALAARIDANAHVIAAAAAAGHPAAQAAVADIAMRARAGDPVAQAQAAVLTQAAKLQIRAKYFAKYVSGGRTSTGAVPCGCH